MNDVSFFRARLYFTCIVTFAIWLLLTWNHYHGGVPKHHILAQKDLPAISNWWGGLLLPLLTWFLLYRAQKRINNDNDKNSQLSNFPIRIIYRFTAALFFGIALSVFFSYGYSDIPGYMLIGLLILALFLPIYRAESLLGFVIGMTFTFGAVLPAGVGSILAVTGVLLYLYIRPAIVFVSIKVWATISFIKHKSGKR